MKNSFYFVLAFLFLGIFLGFSISDNPNGSKTSSNSSSVINAPIDSKDPVTTDGALPYYQDNFDQPSDTVGLKARGYLVYYRGEGPQGTAATWFQGDPTNFVAFNGLTNSYTSSNFNSAQSNNDIDNWLVLPDLDVVAGDTIKFRCRSNLSTAFPDSALVMYNASGGTTPESPGWIQLGVKFRCPDAGWALFSRIVATGGASARFAIRYMVVDGGPAGNNADVMGIDALQVCGAGVLPVELASFVSVISNNNVTLNWTTATEINNSGFDIERSIVNGQWSTVGNVVGNGTTTSPVNYSFTDRNLNSGNYNYRLKQIDFNGNFEYFNLRNEVVIGVPSKFELSQNYPNPFNPSTVINYQLPSLSNVSLSVYNISGKEVKSLVNGKQEAGYYTFELNASDLSSGIYFYRLTTDNFNVTKRMMLVK